MSKKEAELCYVQVYICHDREKVNSECKALVQYVNNSGEVVEEEEYNYPYPPIVLDQIEKIRCEALNSGMMYKCDTLEERKDSD